MASNNRLRTSSRSTAAGTSTLNNNTWYFVTITRDQTQTTLYLNGNLDGTGTPGANPSNPLIIGNLYSLAGNYSFSGQIDEVRVFNHVLSSGEIQMLYYSNLTKTVTNNWSFTTNRTNINGAFSYSGWARDILGYTGVSTSRTINIDSLAPNIPTLLSPTSGQALSTGNIQLRRSLVNDNGIAGMTGYKWQVSTNNFASIYMSGAITTGGVDVLGFPENIYYRRTNAYDVMGNVSTWSNVQQFFVDYTPPTVSTGLISLGSTGVNAGLLYYKGTVDIRANVSDTVVLNT